MKRIYVFLSLLAALGYSSSAVAQFLSLSWPLDKSVTQCAPSGYASVYVAGQLVGCPDSYEKLQMRIEKLDKYGSYNGLVQDYTDISRDNGGLGLFYEEAYLAKGWYHIIVKAVDSGSGTVAINDVKAGVGNVFIIAGQSNAQSIPASGGVPPLLPSAAAYDCVVSNDWENLCAYNHTSSYIPYPLFPIFSKLTGKIAPNGHNRWAYAKLGNQQVDDGNGAVAFFNAASGGTDIGSWKTSADGGSVNSVQTINNCVCCGQSPPLPSNSGLPYKTLKYSLNYYGGMFGTKGVLWHQGETDTKYWNDNPSTYNPDYVNKLNYVISKTRSDFNNGLPWYVSTYATLISINNGSTWTYDITYPTLQGNQVTVASSNMSGAYTDNLTHNFRHPQDYIHLNENSSYPGLTNLASSWHSNINNSSGGMVVAPTLPPLTLNYNSGPNNYTVFAPPGYSDYKWVTWNTELDNGVGSGSSANSITLASSTPYRCWIKQSSGNWMLTPVVYEQSCRSGARLSAEQSLGNAEVNKYNLTLFPNPSSKVVNVKFELPKSARVQLNIISQNGQVLKNVADNIHAEGTFTYPIDVSFLQEGIYLCQLKANDISITKKLIVIGK